MLKSASQLTNSSRARAPSTDLRLLFRDDLSPIYHMPLVLHIPRVLHLDGK